MKVKVNIDEKLDEIFIDIYTPSEDERLKSILDNLQMKKSILNGYIDEKLYLLKINNIYSIYAENKKVYAHTKDKWVEEYKKYQAENEK